MDITTKALIDILSDNDNLLLLLRSPKEFKGLTVKIHDNMYPYISIKLNWVEDLEMIIFITYEMAHITYKDKSIKFLVSIAVLKTILLLIDNELENRDLSTEDKNNIINNIIKSSPTLSILFECNLAIEELKLSTEELNKYIELYANLILVDEIHR